MASRRPPRLDPLLYQGYQRYFLTSCTNGRHRAFESAPVVDTCTLQLRASATRHDFAIAAYCFMPDHVHVLLEGLSDAANFVKFAAHFKQLTGYAYRKDHRLKLWQEGFFDHILRDEESSEAIARYIIGNPIRAGLTREWGEYPFAGSDTFDYKRW